MKFNIFLHGLEHVRANDIIINVCTINHASVNK
jgi:hypothetical protein